MERIKVFTTSYINQLGQRLQSEEVVAGYIQGKAPNHSASDTKNTLLEVESFLKLSIDNGDFENARILYEMLKGIDPTLASDQRLWAWLAHVPFMEYMAKRWPVDKQSKEKRAGYIVGHWFVKTQASTSYMRHGIAMLWWGAYSTYSSERDDPFELTKEFFSMQDYTRTLFGSLGRSDKFIRVLLEYVVENPDLFDAHKEARIRFLMRRLNYAGGYKIIPDLSVAEIKKLINQYKSAAEKIVN